MKNFFEKIPRDPLLFIQKVLILIVYQGFKMSNLENLLYSAEEHGKRENMFIEIRKIRKSPGGDKKSLDEIYQEAYETVMHT